jgi:hypothetical protein
MEVMNLPGIVAVLAPFMMVVGIVWVRSKAQIEEKRIAASKGDNGDLTRQYDRRIAEMEDRIRVLERIVTDGGFNVASQIEALRDTRTIEPKLELEEPARAR